MILGYNVICYRVWCIYGFILSHYNSIYNVILYNSIYNVITQLLFYNVFMVTISITQYIYNVIL